LAGIVRLDARRGPFGLQRPSPRPGSRPSSLFRCSRRRRGVVACCLQSQPAFAFPALFFLLRSIALLCLASPSVMSCPPFRSSRQARDEGCAAPDAVVSRDDDADTEGLGGWVTIDGMDHRSVGRSIVRSVSRWLSLLSSALLTHSAPSVQPSFNKLRSSVAPRAAAAAVAAVSGGAVPPRGRARGAQPSLVGAVDLTLVAAAVGQCERIVVVTHSSF
jgi:hypothetical protein